MSKIIQMSLNQRHFFLTNLGNKKKKEVLEKIVMCKNIVGKKEVDINDFATKREINLKNI